MKRMKWISRKAARVRSTSTANESPRIHISTLNFSDGTVVSLDPDTILVLTGPNNAGKSSTLREIRSHLVEGTKVGPVLSEVEAAAIGTSEQFKQFIRTASLEGEGRDRVRIGYGQYDLNEVAADSKKAFVGRAPAPLFLAHLGAGDRLKLADPTRKGDYRKRPPEEPLQWVEIDSNVERKVASIFKRTFGLDLVVNRLAGSEVVLHVVPPNEGVKEPNFTRQYAQWVAGLPELEHQGDGLRSFAGALLGLLVHPKGLILLDEPEAFLHPPHAKRLAAVVAEETSPQSQIFLATHDEIFLRALLDVSGDRVVVARLTRAGSKNRISILNSSEIIRLWTDPILRTSNILSALFHDVAIVCEGDSDVRFYGAMLEAMFGEVAIPDMQFFHLGGKDRIFVVAQALRAIHVPVVAIVDIDIIADREKLFQLFESLGGSRKDVEFEASVILKEVSSRKGQLTSKELVVELKRLIAKIENLPAELPKVHREELATLAKIGSNWQRLKEDGYRGLVNADAVNAFESLSNKCMAKGLLINPEGELEGFCRQISRTRKSEWLAHVLARNFADDPDLDAARTFLNVVLNVAKEVVEREIP